MIAVRGAQARRRRKPGVAAVLVLLFLPGVAAQVPEAVPYLQEGSTAYGKGDYGAAITLYREALRVYERTLVGEDRRRWSAPVHRALAANYVAVDLPEEALASAELVAEAVRDGLAPASEARLVYDTLAEFLAARTARDGFGATTSLRQRARQLFSLNGLEELTAQWDHDTGMAATAAGRYPDAEAAYARAIKARAQRKDAHGLAWSHNNRAYVRTLDGDLKGALADLAAAAPLVLRNGLDDVAQLLQVNIQGWIARRRDSTQGPAVADAFLELARATRGLRPGAYLDSSWLAAVALELCSGAGADPGPQKEAAEILLESSKGYGRWAWEARAHLALGTLALAEGEVSRAHVEGAQQAAARSGDLHLLAQADLLVARALYHGGEPAEGDARLQQAIDALRRLQLPAEVLLASTIGAEDAQERGDTERLAHWREVAASASSTQRARGGVYGAGTVPAGPEKLAELPVTTPIVGVLRTAGASRSDLESAQDRWVFTAHLKPKPPIEVPVRWSTAYVSLPGVDLLVRGSELQVIGPNDGSGVLTLTGPIPAWDPTRRALPVPPGRKVVYKSDGFLAFE